MYVIHLKSVYDVGFEHSVIVIVEYFRNGNLRSNDVCTNHVLLWDFALKLQDPTWSDPNPNHSEEKSYMGKSIC